MKASELKNIQAAKKGGRSFNASHRDQGPLVHAVPFTTKKWQEPNWNKSLCGTEPGIRGYGWYEVELEINCPKCLKKLSI